jgi:hypothetical protein
MLSNGQRPESNNFFDRRCEQLQWRRWRFCFGTPIDAIEEFRIITHNSNAEFGTSLGSTTNLITRSGANRFHERFVGVSAK